MHPLSTRLVVMALLFAVGTPLFAATYIVPPDAEMIREADAIAIVTIQSSHSYWTRDGRSIATDYEAIVESPLKAAPSAGSKIGITQQGGSVGDLTQFVSSQPEFHVGERTLLMMRRLPMRRFTTLIGELGKFSFVHDVKWRQLLVRGASEGEIFGWDVAGQAHVERSRDAAAFVRYIESVVAGENPVPDYEVEAGDAPYRPIAVNGGFPGSAYTNSRSGGSGTLGIRWKDGSFTMQSVGTQTGVTNLTGSINTSRGVWNNDPNSTIGIGYGGTGTGTYGENNNGSANLIFFDQPDAPPLNGNIIGLANTWAGGPTNTHNSELFYDIVDCDILVEAGKTGTWFEAILAHEMGHCLGFRHSDAGTPNSSTALMKSTTNSGDSSSLRSWDQDAAATVYGNGPVCTPVTITVHPPDKTITAGQLTNLSVLATGTTPYSYQWYIGTSNTDTSNPILGAAGTANPLNVTPSSTTSYWVRVTGCNSSTAVSRLATVTVNQPTCTPPSISGQPPNRTITVGQLTSLSVTAAGTSPFSYQWFIGASGDQSNPIPTGTSAFIQVSPPLGNTMYWVRVTGQCGSPANSNTATVTVTADTCPDVTVQSPTATKQPNGSFVLDVVANSGGGALNYQWFQGPVPGVGTLVNTGKSIAVPAPTAPISYWVRVSNNCNKSAESPTVVTIAPCDLAVIDSEPADQTIASGASATLTVGITSASTPTIRWYRGIAPDKTTEVGQGTSFNTGALTATTQFWASITNLCGEKFTRTVTITVGICAQPAILTTSTAQTKLKGETVTLLVTASGAAPLHYQWYEGIAGDISKPVGTDASTFTSGALTRSTKFWVKVTNGCGSASTPAIDVIVMQPRTRAIRH